MGIKCIGIIPDGTRRWARREGQPLYKAYLHAFINLREQIDHLKDRGVENIHIYMLSIFNLKRGKKDLIACLDAEYETLTDLRDRGYNLFVNGDMDAINNFHSKLAECSISINNHVRNTRNKPTLHLYIGYSFEHHLKKMGSQTTDIDLFISSILNGQIDLIVRTGGAITLSDFLPIESRYSQLYFLPELFNDFTVKELKNLCDDYDKLSLSFKHGE